MKRSLFVVLCVFSINKILFVSSEHDFKQNELKTWKNSTYLAFRGIKYAESPTGSLRFKAPVRSHNWGDVDKLLEQPLNSYGSDCPQPCSGCEYNEDCLYLNVYTKEMKPSTLRPVIIFIHPGGLYMLSGNMFGACYLLEQDVVLVTFNYRLSYFGFSSYETAEDVFAPNAGFKDQVLAMKWVKDHIEHFGGDPNSVTLMGSSAGGLSVELHLVSPLSQGLFHRAIQMSGGLLPQKLLPKSQNHLIDRLAQLINCNRTHIRDSIDCILAADTKSITEQMRKAFDFGYDHPVYPWLPIIEPNSDHAFLSENPFDILSGGRFNKVPLLVSKMKNEAAGAAEYLLAHEELLLEMYVDFERVGPLVFLYDPNRRDITSELEKVYINSTGGQNHKLFHTLTNAFSSSLNNFPIHRLVELTKNYIDIYYMVFEYIGQLNNYTTNCLATFDREFCGKIDSDKIAQHLEDHGYIFSTLLSKPIQPNSSRDSQMVEKHTKLIGAFAKNGVPDFNGEVNPSQAKYDDREHYVRVDDTYELKTHPYDEYDLWNRLFPN